MLVNVYGQEMIQTPGGTCTLVENTLSGELHFAVVTAAKEPDVDDDDGLPEFIAVTDFPEPVLKRVLKSGVYEPWRLPRSGVLWLRRAR